MKLEELPTLPGHVPHTRKTRRHCYLCCGCGWDCRVSHGTEPPWFRWGQHLEQVALETENERVIDA